MTTAVITYIIALVMIGTTGYALMGKRRYASRIAPAAIALLSVIVLLLLVVACRKSEMYSVLTLPGWQLPFAAMIIGCDPLSLLFLFPLCILACCSALFGPRYLAHHPAPRAHWFFFSLLIAGMAAVLIARNAVLFIISWETMSLASFFLVISDTKNESSIKAGWIYFVTAHIGTALLLCLLFMLSSTSGSFDFNAWNLCSFSPCQANLIFALAITAFGFKAGFIPCHVWLPLAHPAAPSHVSSIMSGIMIKMGIYGILRIITFIMPFQAWWGFILIGIGAFSTLLGILFAMGQNDLKRLLAYSSVENIGIILLGIGSGILGICYKSEVVALFSFAGAFLHIINHSLFKSMLFLGGGAIISQTGTGELDRLGGLIRSMPKTAHILLIGILGIGGLPFLNGFISELYIYAGSISGAIQTSAPILACASLVIILVLGFAGGLAIACFTKLYGTVFLGEPRLGAMIPTGEIPLPMRVSIVIPAFLCSVIGLFSKYLVPFLLYPVRQFLITSDEHALLRLFSLSSVTGSILFACGILMLFTAGIMAIINRRKRPVANVDTWDCGYTISDPSMQYTATSFTAPIIEFFHGSVGAKTDFIHDADPFPGNKWSLQTSIDDWFLSRIYTPIAQILSITFSRLEWLQSGKIGQYVLYIALTVLGIIIWKFLP